MLSGGIFNVLGDWFFVFPCDMGVYGAGLATALGSAVSFLVMLTHFASRKNTLRLVKPKRLARKLWKIAVTGFSSFFIDVAMGILTVLFNRQIMRYLGADALAANILDGKTAFVNGVKLTGSMPDNGSATATMDGLTTTSVTIPAGYTAGGTVSLTSDIEEALAAI